MIKKEWWLAAGAVSAAVSGQEVLAQNAPERAGVAAAVNPAASGQLAGGPSRVMVVASDVFRDEKIVTDAGGQVHLLFLDESAVTVGPNSEITLDRFVYDPQTNQGELALTAARGAMRFIGGKLSKVNPVEIRTQTATIGVRGCTLFLSGQGNNLTAIFAAGVSAEFRQNGNVVATLSKPGAALDIANGVIGQPYQATPAQFQAATAAFRGRPVGGPGFAQGARSLANANSAQPPTMTAPGQLIGTLSDATNSNANTTSNYGGNTGGNALQVRNRDATEGQSARNNSP